MGCRYGTKYAKATENELMHWYYCCDDTAFEALWWCRLYGWVTRFVALRVRNPVDMQDIVMNAVCKILNTKHQPDTRFDPRKGTLHSWVARIVSNEISDYFEKRDREPPISALMNLSESAGEEIFNTWETLLTYEPSGGLTPDDIQKAVQKLGEPSRTIVLLYFWEEFTQEEISKELGISVATVNRKLKRDLACLREILTRMKNSDKLCRNNR